MNKLYLGLRHCAFKVYLNAIYPVVLKARAKAVGKKDKIQVVFFAVNIAMWRYQGVYELLSKEERFDCHIVLSVFTTINKAQQAEELRQLKAYFDCKGIQYHDYDVANGVGYDVIGKINPDILFYPQPYDETLPGKHNYRNYLSKLWCYCSYSLNVVKPGWFLFDLPFHNLAWKIYCPTHFEKEDATQVARNHGRNWMISGYSNLDRYCDGTLVDVWKPQEKRLKRLIWAPHFTLTKGLTFIESRNSFIWMAQLMLDVSQRFKGRLQIAFKPHPRLKSELYKHPDWGVEKTDKYYEQWANGENTQLETGDFVDLFKSSDAMIHDCGSFTAEYLYVNKPVAFVSTDIELLKKDHNEFGCAALDQHYIVKNEEEVLNFIEKVVLGEDDPMKEQRTAFFESVLRPNVTGSTSEFIVNDMKKSLGID